MNQGEVSAEIDALYDHRSDPRARAVLEDFERSRYRTSSVARLGYALSLYADADAAAGDADADADGAGGDADADADAAAADAAAAAAAARKNARIRQSEKLLELMAAAPVVQTSGTN